MSRDVGDDDARDDASDEDPLDAYMATLVPDARDDAVRARASVESDDDAFETSVMMMRARGRAVGRDGRARARVREEEARAASDGDGDGTRDAREVVGDVDHASVSYETFVRVTYATPKELSEMSRAEVDAARAALDVRVDGCDAAPVTRFGQGGALNVDVLRALKRLEFETPTAIQAQSLPVIAGGRDALVLATTGSGKTLAFLLPAFAQISRQRPLAKAEGPIALVLAPTRELATQIAHEANRFHKAGVPVRCCAIFGGVSKHDQFKKLRAGAELVVATPGRLIDLLHMKNSTDLRRVTYVALDEADRMLDMGFERAVRSICRAVRPDRQCVLFSATMARGVQSLVREVLAHDFVTISLGQVGAANQDVRQVVHVFENDERRANWLFNHLGEFINDGQALVFVNHKSSVEDMVRDLSLRGIKSVGLHGDLDQTNRQASMRAFKSEQAHVLVATDIAARGLDVESIKTVINYQMARDMATHVHRIGRTGRAGATDGVAYTLLTPLDCSAKFASNLEHSLMDSGQQVPLDLKTLARGTYKRARPDDDDGTPRRGKVGGRGIGFVGSRAPAPSAPGGRGPRPIPNADFTAVPPPMQESVVDAVASARAKAESIAARFRAPPPPSPPPPPPPPPSDAAAAAIAAARAIAERLTARAPSD